MDAVPVQRQPSFCRPAFKWEIYHWYGYSLLAGNLITSPEFWCNGYKMAMQLRLSTPKDSYELSLHVLDLKPGSHVNIAWSAHSQLFKTPIDSEKIDHWESVKRNTFTRWKLKREVNVNFKFV